MMFADKYWKFKIATESLFAKFENETTCININFTQKNTNDGLTKLAYYMYSAKACQKGTIRYKIVPFLP